MEEEQIRDLTQLEQQTLLGDGRCTFCSGKVFGFGPRGAAALNIFCATCGAGFNICVPVGIPAQLIRKPRS